MKTTTILKVALLAIPLTINVSCRSLLGLSKKTEKTENTQTAKLPAQMTGDEFLAQVTKNAQSTRFITSKIKFSVEVGSHQMTLTGNLRMKRNDVIQMQLMAFGFVEAARLEFTEDYVLIMDRINKQFLKVPYEQMDFLRNNGIDFNVMQALFWNELFIPGKSGLTEKNLKTFNTNMDGDEVVISLENEKLSYKWLVNKSSANVEMTNVMLTDRFRGNYVLNWEYEDFKYNNRKLFPMNHKILFSTPSKQVKLGIKLNYMGADEDWETRTVVSGKYRKVEVDEILRRFMAL
jgi:hypothetical protein